MKQTINHNSSVNQDIKRKFVDREVIILASDIVDEFQKINPSWFEDWDIRNLYFYPCPECGGSMEERAVKWVCNNCKHRQTEEPEQEMQEIYEYWFVAKWLAEKLEEKGADRHQEKPYYLMGLSLKSVRIWRY